jgi:hypothetical protein
MFLWIFEYIKGKGTFYLSLCLIKYYATSTNRRTEAYDSEFIT